MSRRGENIRKRKDDRWEGRYLVNDPRTVRSIAHSVYARNYGEARKKLSKARQSKRSISRECRTDEKIYGVIGDYWWSIYGSAMMKNGGFIGISRIFSQIKIIYEIQYGQDRGKYMSTRTFAS